MAIELDPNGTALGRLRMGLWNLRAVAEWVEMELQVRFNGPERERLLRVLEIAASVNPLMAEAEAEVAAYLGAFPGRRRRSEKAHRPPRTSPGFGSITLVCGCGFSPVGVSGSAPGKSPAEEMYEHQLSNACPSMWVKYIGRSVKQARALEDRAAVRARREKSGAAANG